MAGILLTKDRIHTHLTSLGHRPTEDTFSGATGLYRIWVAPWGLKFAVPDEDHKCATWDLENILEGVYLHRPSLQ